MLHVGQATRIGLHCELLVGAVSSGLFGCGARDVACDVAIQYCSRGVRARVRGGWGGTRVPHQVTGGSCMHSGLSRDTVHLHIAAVAWPSGQLGDFAIIPMADVSTREPRSATWLRTG